MYIYCIIKGRFLIFAFLAQLEGSHGLLALLVFGTSFDCTALWCALDQNWAAAFANDYSRFLTVLTSLHRRTWRSYTRRFAAFACIIFNGDLMAFWALFLSGRTRFLFTGP